MMKLLILYASTIITCSCSLNSSSKEDGKIRSAEINDKDSAYHLIKDTSYLLTSETKRYLTTVDYDDLSISLETIKSTEAVVNSAFFPEYYPILKQDITFLHGSKSRSENLINSKIPFKKRSGDLITGSDCDYYSLYFVKESKAGTLVVLRGDSEVGNGDIYEFEIVFSKTGNVLFDGYLVRDVSKYETFVDGLGLKKKGLDNNSDLKLAIMMK